MKYEETPNNSYGFFSNFENKLHKSTSWTLTHLSPTHGMYMT